MNWSRVSWCFVLNWLIGWFTSCYFHFKFQNTNDRKYIYIYIYVPLDPRAGFGWAFKRPLPPIVLYSNQEKKNSDERKTWVQNKDDLRGWLIISIKVGMDCREQNRNKQRDKKQERADEQKKLTLTYLYINT